VGGMGGWPVDPSNSPVSRFESAYLRRYAMVAEVRHKQGIAHDTAPQNDHAQLNFLLMCTLSLNCGCHCEKKFHRIILVY